MLARPQLKLVNVIGEGVKEGDVVENTTWTAEVYIANNHFSKIPTRGLLISTRKKCSYRK